MNVLSGRKRDNGGNREFREKKAVANYLEGLHRETGNQGRSIT